MRDNKAPCKGCQDRWMNDTKTCHSECQKYLEWKKENEKLKKEINFKTRLDKDSYSTMDSMYFRKSVKAMQSARREK